MREFVRVLKIASMDLRARYNIGTKAVEEKPEFPSGRDLPIVRMQDYAGQELWIITDKMDGAEYARNEFLQPDRLAEFIVAKINEELNKKEGE